MSRRKLLDRARHGALNPEKRTEYAAKLLASHGPAIGRDGQICSRPMHPETAQRIAGITPKPRVSGGARGDTTP